MKAKPCTNRNIYYYVCQIKYFLISLFADVVSGMFNCDMAQRRTVSFRLNPELADQFHQATSAFYGKVGDCFGAAILMFIRADPKEQAEFVKRVYEAELEGEIDIAVQQAKDEQFKRIKAREDGAKHKRGT